MIKIMVDDNSQDSMETMGMAELLAMEDANASTPSDSNGKSFINAKVVSISSDGALVDIGEKAEALIPAAEWGEHPPFSIGDTVMVLNTRQGQRDGVRRVSWKAACEQQDWKTIEDAYKNRIPVQAEVKSETRGGLLLKCEHGLTGFMPSSQVELRPVRDLKKWIGKSITVYIMEYDIRKNNLVLSRKLWLSEYNQKMKAETFSTLKEGDVKKGVVSGITSFGAFVDIGGVEGLLHIGELEWSHTNKVSDVLKVGQEIEVKVIKFDPQTEKISLSRKSLLPHPWDDVEQRFPIGSVYTGKVVSVTDFGAFIEIAPQVEGLLHASEISWKSFSQKPQELLKNGETVKVKVISVNRNQEKIALSMKRTGASPWDGISTKYPAGSSVSAVISYLVPFGAFARLPEGVEGLIHISDFSWSKRVRHPEDILKVGQEITVKVLEVNEEKEKISFGLKQLKPNPYQTYSKGAKVEAVISQVVDAGAVATIDQDVEGFIPRSEIPSENKERTSQLLCVGDKVEAKVISVDQKERKITLSIRQMEMELQRAAEARYSAASRLPPPKLGELLES